jgi:hypothetical protein
MKLLSIIGMGLFFLSWGAVGETEDKNSLLQIAQGDKLVLKKDLNIPANTDRLYYQLKIDSGYKNSGCALVLNPSQKSRRIPQGSDLVFSGKSHAQKTVNEFHNVDYTYTAEMMNSETVTALECYGTSFQSQYGDLYVLGMKEKLKEFFDFIAAEPEIVK